MFSGFAYDFHLFFPTYFPSKTTDHRIDSNENDLRPRNDDGEAANEGPHLKAFTQETSAAKWDIIIIIIIIIIISLINIISYHSDNYDHH